MAEPLKLMFNKEFFDRLAAALRAAYPAFDGKRFSAILLEEGWDRRELKQRMRHITHCLQDTLPSDYRASLDILKRTAEIMQKTGFEMMFLPDFVEVYGLDDWQASLPALEVFTPYCSSEFAVRPFIIADPERMMAQMEQWAEHENHHVRRLASEGCRPRLPWAMALPAFKRDPAPILPILERLKADPSDYVRRSAANNLNDIAKDHPQLVLELAEAWAGMSRETDWIIKHGCRTLLKKGNRQAFALFDFAENPQVRVQIFSLSKETAAIGEEVEISFELQVNSDELVRLRIEYAIDFVKANGSASRKLFKITENEYSQSKPAVFNRRHSFKDLTTRKHYAGKHQLSLVVNGAEVASVYVWLTASRL